MDKVNIAFHRLVPTALFGSVVVVVDMNPSVDEFVPHSAFSQSIVVVDFQYFFWLVKKEMAKCSIFANRSTQNNFHSN